MLHFIPAWYKQNQWCENEQTWHSRRRHTEFDDTVKQVQLFQRGGFYPFQIMLISFAPNFRHFLHRQGVYHAPYWSCFDAIQGIRRKKARVFSFRNLDWPENIEFIYSPFVVIALLKKEKYAQIEFGEDGNLIQIDLFKNGMIYRRNIYDDRGFVSSTVILHKDELLYQEYLSENGVWKLRYFQRDGHVEVNPQNAEYCLLYRQKEQIKKFSQLSYTCMEDVIYEVLASYLDLTGNRDIFCVAMHERHIGILNRALKNKKIILSIFSERFFDIKNPEVLEIIKKSDYIIADSEKSVTNIQNKSGLSINNITAITPYDSRVDMGISQQFEVQKILVPVDGISDGTFEKLIQLLGEYIPFNENARIHLFTRKADYNKKSQILERARKVLEQAGMEEGWAEEVEEKNVVEYNLEAMDVVPVKFFVQQCVDELSVTKCMREQRLLVDLREVPELYLQITAISIGIPQIVRTRTEFVKAGRNGIILDKMEDLPESLAYYLSGLKNWNEARIYSFEVSKEYTTEKLIETWKGVIEFLE